MAVQEVFGGEVAWFFEFDKAPSKILAYHWPDVPNYGDMTTADWAGIEQVDILCGGTPCQDLSGAGKRAGMTEGTRSNLWVQMRECIAIQRPSVVVWENVRGAYSAGADSEVERTEGLLGGTPGGSLRALGRVLGDLSSLGYDSRVIPLRASDVGAAHQRYRVFVVAYDSDPERIDRGQGWAIEAIKATRGRSSGEHRRRNALPADSESNPRRFEHGDHGAIADADGCGSGESVSVAGGEGTIGDWAGVVDECGPRSAHRLAYTTPDEQRLVDEYTALWESIEDHHPYFIGEDGTDYWDAILGHEQMIGRRVPPPSIPDGKKGNHRYSPFMGEWMMGLPFGHVTNPAIGLTRNEIHKACGNGVVPQQAIAAIRMGVHAHTVRMLVAA